MSCAPQTIHSPPTTMSKLNQWMQSLAAMSSNAPDHAVPVRTRSLPSPQSTRSGRSLTSSDHYLRTQPPCKPKTSKPKGSKPTAESDQGFQDQVNADSVGNIRITLLQAAPRSPPPCQQLPTHPKRPATPTPPLSGPVMHLRLHAPRIQPQPHPEMS